MKSFNCTPQQIADCPFVSHYQDLHHLYHPRRDYRTKVEKAFRELPENKEQLCRNEHQQRHLTEVQPEKPTRQEMLDAIAGVLVSSEMEQHESQMAG